MVLLLRKALAKLIFLLTKAVKIANDKTKPKQKSLLYYTVLHKKISSFPNKNGQMTLWRGRGSAELFWDMVIGRKEVLISARAPRGLHMLW